MNPVAPIPRLTLPAAANIVRWLVWDTVRQAVSSRIFGVMMTVSAIAILFCAGVSVHGGDLPKDAKEVVEFVPRTENITPEISSQTGVERVRGELRLGFGAIRIPHARDVENSIHFLQLLLAAGVAGTLGVLLALVWTAGFLPSFLEPASASILLTKPAPRWLMVLGKYLGMVLFVGAQSAVFVVGTWLALGLATGVWTETYLLAVPLIMLQFAFFYSFSMLLAVTTRSTIVCVVGSILFWVGCTAVNTARIDLAVNPASPPLTRRAAEVGYWLLPKPVDLNLMVSRTLSADKHFAPWPALQQIEKQGRFSREWSLISSALFASVMIAASALAVGRVDY